MSRYVSLKLSFKEKLIFLLTGVVKEDSVVSAYNSLKVEPCLKCDEIPLPEFTPKEVEESEILSPPKPPAPRNINEDVKLPNLFSSKKKKIKTTNLRDL